MLILLLCMGVAFAKKQPENDRKSRLLAGDILHQYTRLDEAGGAIRAEVLINAPLEDIWGILQGCGKAFIFVDGLEQCDIIERSGDITVIHQVVDTGIFSPTLDYSYRSRMQAFTQMDFEMLEGNLRVLQGGWKFKTIPEGVLVSYDMRVRPGFPVPRFLVRMSLRRMIPDMLACIRGLVDGSGSAEQKKSDLKQCPGKV